MKNKIGQYLIIVFLLCFWIYWAYTHYISISTPAETTGDESKYLWFAENIKHGFYSKKGQEADLWYTPGYPLVLAILSSISKNILFLRSTSILFILCAYLLLALTIKKETKISILFSLAICTLVIPWYQDAIDFFKVHTESFVFLLFSLLLYFVSKFRHSKSNKHLLIAGLVLGYISLTKVLFMYIIILVTLLMLFLKWKLNWDVQKIIRIHFISIMVMTPYLFYSFYITGKIFYTSSGGGMQLYYMTTPLNPMEPNWMGFKDARKDPYHNKAFEKIDHDNISVVDLDQKFKEIALNNIKKHPTDYIKKIILNPAWLFGYPLSRSSIIYLTLFFKYYFILNIFLLIILFGIINRLRNFDIFDQWLLLFCCTYLFCSLFLTANLRFFLITFPVLFYLTTKTYFLQIRPRIFPKDTHLF